MNLPKVIYIKVDFRFYVLIFTVIFGFYGWGTNGIIINNFSTIFSYFFNSVLICTSVALLYKYRHLLLYSRKISLKEISNFIKNCVFISIPLLMLTFNNFKRSLAADELAHAWFSHSQSYVLLIGKFGPYIPAQIGSAPAHFLVQIQSLLILTLLFAFAWLSLKIQSQIKFVISAIFFIFVSRLIVSIAGGFSAPNSPLPNFWYFIFTSVFGINNLTFRIASFLPFAILYTYIFLELNKFISKIASYISILAIFTIPLILNMSNLVEIANWGYLFSTYIIFRLISTRGRVSYHLLILLAMSFYLRNPLIYLTLGFLVGALNRKIFPDFARKIIPFFIILFPGITQIFIRRVMDTQTKNFNIDMITINFKQTLMAIKYSESTGVFILFIISFILLWYFENNLRIFETFLLIGIFVVFFVANENELTRISKYLIEIIYPLATCIILVLAKIWFRFYKSKVFINLMVIFMSAILLVSNYNLNKQINITYASLSTDTSRIDSGYEALPFDVVNYSSIFSFIRKSNLSSCLNTGVVYSVFPEIINNMSLKYVFEARNIRERFLYNQEKLGENQWSVSLESLKMSKINCVIIGATLNSEKIKELLVKNGWKNIFTSENIVYNSNAYILFKLK